MGAVRTHIARVKISSTAKVNPVDTRPAPMVLCRTRAAQWVCAGPRLKAVARTATYHGRPDHQRYPHQNWA